MIHQEDVLFGVFQHTFPNVCLVQVVVGQTVCYVDGRIAEESYIGKITADHVGCPVPYKRTGFCPELSACTYEGYLAVFGGVAQNTDTEVPIHYHMRVRRLLCEWKQSHRNV